jgi:regulator of sigma E protease
MQVILFIIALLLFTALIIVHEWGHFFAARRNGVTVEEFGLGFPPRAFGRKTKKGMMLSFNWLPIGGFVKLKGEHDGDKRKGSFGAASLGAKTKIMLAGVAMNLLVAFAIFTFLYAVGMPKLITNDQFGQDQFAVNSHTSKQEVLAIYVEPSSPAQKAGLSNLDKIISLNSSGEEINIGQTSDLRKATPEFAGKPVTLTFLHNGQVVTKQITLRTKAEVAASHNKKGYLGVQPYNLAFIKSGWSAPASALGFTWQLTRLSFAGLWHAIAGLGSIVAGFVTGNHAARVSGQSAASGQVGGPVAILKILWSTGSIGYLYMLAIIGMISLTLAIFNILPIPALDGGRLFLILFSRGVLRKPLSRIMEERIVAAGMVVLLTMTLLITVVDIKRFL